MHTCKQSAVTFEVFVLWLRNQHYYIHNVIGIKMTYGDLLYYEGVRVKTHCKNKLHDTKNIQTLYIPLENGPLLGPSLFYLLQINIG